METLLLYTLVTPSLFYLGSRAVITSFLWSRYPHKLASFMDCSACSGTWYGALVAYAGGYHLGLDVLGLDGATPAAVVAVALGSMTWTPIVAGLVQRGFDTLGSAVSDPVPEGQPQPEPLVRAETDTIYIGDVESEQLEQARRLRAISGTIVTPREIPVVRIPPKEPDGSGSG